jgi:hypothetical protein
MGPEGPLPCLQETTTVPLVFLTEVLCSVDFLSHSFCMYNLSHRPLFDYSSNSHKNIKTKPMKFLYVMLLC